MSNDSDIVTLCRLYEGSDCTAVFQPHNRVVCRLASEMIKGREVSERNRDGCVADGHNYSRTPHTEDISRYFDAGVNPCTIPRRESWNSKRPNSEKVGAKGMKKEKARAHE